MRKKKGKIYGKEIASGLERGSNEIGKICKEIIKILKRDRKGIVT